MPNPMPNPMPTWEQRVRAPQLATFSLLGPPVSWAADRADRGVLLATPSGRTEVYAFDASTVPATLRQVTDRPQGTLGASVSPDGSSVFWFDDLGGSEVGRWQRTGFSGGPTTTLLPDLDPSYPAGITPVADGRVVVGRLVDTGFEIAVADTDGLGTAVYRDAQPATLMDVSSDARLALIGFAPDGDWLHVGVRVVNLAAGDVVAELVRDGANLEPVAFHPSDSRQVLLGHEPRDRLTPAVWDTDTGAVDDVDTGLPGDVTATWDPSGEALLLTSLQDGRNRLFRFDRVAGSPEPVELPAGTVSASSARPDGSVHALVSRSDLPPSLVESRDGVVTDLVRLPGDPPAATVAVSDAHVPGPAGQVHALVRVPADGESPHPTLFFVHGGPTGQDRDAWDVMAAALVDAGYAVVRVNYRGSTGYGAAWRDALHARLGFIELEDVSAVRERLVADGLVDPARVGILGGSWGGFLTLMALGTQPDQWVSGAAMVPLADWFTASEDSPPWMKAYDASLMGGTLEEIPEVYRAASPITYVDAVRAPVFVTAGENDPRCPVRQVDTYVERLRARGHPVEYTRLAAGHALPDLDETVAELRDLLDFLARTLPTG